jgi:hypothetical protein
MPLPSTMTPITTNTLSATATSVTFSNVPQGYTDLYIVWNGSVNTSQNVSLQFNSDTGSNYSATRLRGTGSAAESSRWSNITLMYGPNPDTTGNSTVVWQVMNYSNSTTNKTGIARGGGAGGETGAYVGLWRNTAAITSVTVIINGSATMSSGTSLTIYGIKAA